VFGKDAVSRRFQRFALVCGDRDADDIGAVGLDTDPSAVAVQHRYRRCMRGDCRSEAEQAGPEDAHAIFSLRDFSLFVGEASQNVFNSQPSAIAKSPTA